MLREERAQESNKSSGRKTVLVGVSAAGNIGPYEM
jgi:hypothetical protein